MRSIVALAPHPIADVLPLISGRDFDDLVASIQADGQLEPIVL